MQAVYTQATMRYTVPRISFLGPGKRYFHTAPHATTQQGEL